MYLLIPPTPWYPFRCPLSRLRTRRPCPSPPTPPGFFPSLIVCVKSDPSRCWNNVRRGDNDTPMTDGGKQTESTRWKHRGWNDTEPQSPKADVELKLETCRCSFHFLFQRKVHFHTRCCQCCEFSSRELRLNEEDFILRTHITPRF